jgi:pimeloyl-ACP methyl ester carboxylesterase
MQSLSLREWDTVIRWCVLPGEGVPIVCLPGLSFAVVPNFLTLMTRPQFSGRRILLVDYVGSGLSGHSKSFGFSLDEHATSIAAVLDAACKELVHLLGYSMGGTVAVSVALMRPDLVFRLVVCEGNLKPGGGEASRRIAASDHGTFIVNDHPERMNSLAKAATSGEALPDFLGAARSRADPRGIHANALALVNLADDFEERFLALQVERHYVYGEQGLPKVLRSHSRFGLKASERRLPVVGVTRDNRDGAAQLAVSLGRESQRHARKGRQDSHFRP